MRTGLVYFVFAILFIFAPCDISAQKKDPRLKSGQNLKNTLITVIRTADEIKSPRRYCDEKALLKSIPRKILVPSKVDLAKEIGRMMDSLVPNLPLYDNDKRYIAMRAAGQSTKIKGFFYRLNSDHLWNPNKKEEEELKKYYDKIKRIQKNGIDLEPHKTLHDYCNITTKINMRPDIWKTRDKKNKDGMTVTWSIIMNIGISCSCKKNLKHKVKETSFRYTASVSGPFVLDKHISFHPKPGFRIEKRFGLRFGKVVKPKMRRTSLVCCPVKENKPEDGSFADPNEPINYYNFVVTNVGFSTASEEENEFSAGAGVLFNVTTLGENPLFVGPTVNVGTTSLNGNDYNATKVLIGPTAEYHLPVGANQQTRLIAGANAGYLFGNVDSFGFESTLSGFAAGLYGGVQIPISNAISIGATLGLFEYNNTTFKAKEGDFENTASNSLFLWDRQSISAGVRINLK